MSLLITFLFIWFHKMFDGIHYNEMYWRQFYHCELIFKNNKSHYTILKVWIWLIVSEYWLQIVHHATPIRRLLYVPILKCVGNLFYLVIIVVILLWIIINWIYGQYKWTSDHVLYVHIVLRDRHTRISCFWPLQMYD